jgi:hypothetical protein
MKAIRAKVLPLSGPNIADRGGEVVRMHASKHQQSAGHFGHENLNGLANIILPREFSEYLPIKRENCLRVIL